MCKGLLLHCLAGRTPRQSIPQPAATDCHTTYFFKIDNATHPLAIMIKDVQTLKQIHTTSCTITGSSMVIRPRLPCPGCTSCRPSCSAALLRGHSPDGTASAPILSGAYISTNEANLTILPNIIMLSHVSSSAAAHTVHIQELITPLPPLLHHLISTAL